MSLQLYEQLENLGLLRGTSPVKAAVRRITPARMRDISEEAAALTSASDLERQLAPYSFTASLALGGSRSCCWYIGCRRRRIGELARFSALYADQVYINNFLSDYRPSSHVLTSLDDLEWRMHFEDDITLLAALRPLVEAGRVNIITPATVVCTACLANESFGEAADKRFATIRRDLRRRFLEETTAKAELRYDELAIDLSGPSDLFDHGGRVTGYRGYPPAIADSPGLVGRLEAGRTIPLSKKLKQRLGIHDDYAEEVLNDIVFELAVTQSFGTAFLTDRPIHIAVLNRLSRGSGGFRESTNAIAMEHLQSIVPFAADVPLRSILKLRVREADAFLAFRHAMNQAIEDVRGESTSLTKSQARQIYADNIAPQLARLDRAVRNAKRDLTARSLREAASWTAVIAFGMYVGLLPEGLLLAAKSLGLYRVAASLVSQIGNPSVPSNVRMDDMYFLWRVRNAARRRAA